MIISSFLQHKFVALRTHRFWYESRENDFFWSPSQGIDSIQGKVWTLPCIFYAHYSLRVWCQKVRISYRKIKEEGRRGIYQLSDANIKRLNDVGFDFGIRKILAWDDRFNELVAFKEKIGHCQVPHAAGYEYYTLGTWCYLVKSAFKKKREGGKPTMPLPDEKV